MSPNLLNRLSGLCRRAFAFTLLGLLLAPALRAQSDAVHDFAIEAQPLAESLDAFSQATGIDVVSRSAWLRGKNAPAVEGEYAAGAALERILSESGLAYRFTGERTVAVTTPRQTTSDLQTLDLEPVTLDGQPTLELDEARLQGSGRLEGFRAEMSATATRIDAPMLQVPLRDLPRSVGLVDDELFDLQGIRDPQEAVKNVSGIQRSASFTGIGETYILRGFEQNDIFKDGFRNGTSTNLRPTATTATDIANLERIEVFKGPTAILFGRGEPGGVVNYVTRRPDFENSLMLQQDVGSDSYFRSRIRGNWNAVPDTLALGLDASWTDSESFIDFMESESLLLAPSLVWKISEDTMLTFRGEYLNDRRHSDPGVPVVGGSVLPVRFENYYGEPSVTEFEGENLRGMLQIEHRWNENHTTNAFLHGRKGDTEGAFLLLASFGGPAFDPATGDIFRIFADGNWKDENLAARVDHTYETTLHDSDNLKIDSQTLVSLGYEEDNRDSFRLLSGYAPINAFNPVFSGFAPLPIFPTPGFPTFVSEADRLRAEATSLLLMERLSFNDRLHLSFGGRVDWFEATNSTDFPGPPVPFGDIMARIDETTFNPSVGVVYKPIEEVSLYGSYSESTNSFTNLGFTTVTGASLDPEESRQFEIGGKSEWGDGRYAVSAALFQIDKSDVAGTDPANPFFSINAGDERVRGFETDARIELVPGWMVLANYTWLDSEITFDPSGATTGNERFGTPEHSARLFSVYEIQDGSMRGFGFGGGVNVRDEVQLDNANSATLPSFVTAEFLAYYQRDAFRAQINVNNAFDEETFYGTNNPGSAARGPGRQVFASVRYEF